MKAKKNIIDKGQEKEKEKEKEKENGKEKNLTPNKVIHGNDKKSPSEKINTEKIELKIMKKEEKEEEEKEEEEEEEEEEEKEVEVSLKLNKSLVWFQTPLPPEKNSYTPVHILSRTFPVATTSATSSSENDSSAVKDSLDRSIDCVRNEVLEVLTKTIYSVARSLRSDPVSLIRLNSVFCARGCDVHNC